MNQRRERFLHLLDAVHDRLERFCFAVARDRDDAFDLFGDTVLRAWERFDTLRDERAFLAWLFTTAVRLHRRRRVRSRFFGRWEPEYAERLGSRERPHDEAADITILHKAIGRLPVLQREAVVLFELSGLTLEEIVAVQGGTVGALKVRLHRARTALAAMLGETSASPSSDIPSPTLTREI